MRLLFLCLNLLLFTSLSTSLVAQQDTFASTLKNEKTTSIPLTEENCPSHIVGAPCSDGNDCTINDAYDANCNCLGVLKDANENNICDSDEEATSSSSFNVGADLVSRYVWRGLAYSKGRSWAPWTAESVSRSPSPS